MTIELISSDNCYSYSSLP